MAPRKHVIVTGGSRGLGEAMVRRMLADGYRVSTCSRSKTPFVEDMLAHGDYRERFLWANCDIGVATEVDRFVKDTVAWAGADKLYGLVNNAAIAMAGILATFPNVDSERILRVNLLGAIEMARAASQVLLRQDSGGRVINVSSIIGSRGYNGLAAYSASKAGLDGLTRSLARELGRRRITVNSVAPGYMRTEMSSTLNAGHLAQIVNRTPLGRLATENDVVGLVMFLLSEEAAFITGQTIMVDGGISS
jgi:3-oxoacyl-[acyl-carrier protein] reductase